MAGRPKIHPSHHFQGISLEMEGCSSSIDKPPFSIYQNHTYLNSGSSFLTSQKSDLCSTKPTSFSFPHFHRAQKQRQTQANYRLKQSESVHRLSHISHDDTPTCSRSDVSPDLGRGHRSAGCLSAYSYSTQPTSLSRFLLSEPTIFFSSSTIRPKRSSLNFHPNLKVASCKPEVKRLQRSSLPRRLGCLGQLGSDHQASSSGHYGASPTARVLNQPRKVTTNSNSATPLARSPMGSTPGSLEHTTRENSIFISTHPQRPCKSLLLSQKMGINTRTTELRGSLPFTSQTTPAADTTPTMARELPPQGCSPKNPSTSSNRIKKMASTTCPNIFSKILSRCSSPDPLDRCIPRRMGRAHSTPPNFRFVGCISSQSSYQSTRDPSSPSQYMQLRSQRESTPCLHRQPSGPNCYKQRTQPLSNSVVRGRIPHNRSSQQKSYHQSLQNFNAPQPKGRCSQQRLTITSGGCSSRGDVSENHQLERASPDRSYGFSNKCQTTFICESPPGPSGCRTQCFSSGLEPMVRDLPFPTSLAHPSHSRETRGIQGSRRLNSPVVANRKVVPEINEENSGRTNPREQPNWLHHLRNSDRSQFLKEVISFKQGPTVAKQLLLAFRASTNKQSQSVWKTFQSWLPADATSISTTLVLEFLIFLHESKHLGPRTILNYKGCLAWPLREAFGLDLNSNEFSLLSRSLFLQCPPRPKKVPRWSIDTALNTFQSSRFCLQSACLEDLFLKTIFLTTLASGNRASELAATIREGIQYEQSSVTIPVAPSFLFKNQSIKNPNPPPIVFPSLPSNRELCPVSFLSKYLEKTQEFPHQGSIFIHPKTHRPLKAGRLSYWLSKAIATGDPIGGSGHDLRKLGHSLAFTRGLDLNQIVKNGSWQSANVFIRNYLISTSLPAHMQFVAGRT